MPYKKSRLTLAVGVFASPFVLLSLSFADGTADFGEPVDPTAYSEEFVELPPPVVEPPTISIEAPVPQVEFEQVELEGVNNDIDSADNSTTNPINPTNTNIETVISDATENANAVASETDNDVADTAEETAANHAAGEQNNTEDTASQETSSNNLAANSASESTDIQPAPGGTSSVLGDGSPAGLNTGSQNSENGKYHWPTILAAFLALLSLAILIWLLLLKISNAPAKPNKKSFY